MASPQKENGYTAIANEIMDALIQKRIPGEAMQVLMFIIRKTYGFNKSEDPISLSQFVNATSIKKNSVCRALSKLIELNYIHKKVNEIATIYRFNKDFERWKPFTKKRPFTKTLTTIHKKVKNHSLKSDIQKTVLKDTLTKDIGEAPKNEINDLIDFFKKVINPHLKFNNKTERQSSEELINTYGLEKTKQALLFLEEKRKTDKYLPLITTPYELLTKWAKIKQHLQTKKRKVWTPTTSHSLPSLQAQSIK